MLPQDSDTVYRSNTHTLPRYVFALFNIIINKVVTCGYVGEDEADRNQAMLQPPLLHHSLCITLTYTHTHEAQEYNCLQRVRVCMCVGARTGNPESFSGTCNRYAEGGGEKTTKKQQLDHS